MFRRPGELPPVPAVVAALAGRRPLTQVWHNELGGLAYEIGTDAVREFVKWCPRRPEFDLAREAAKLAWAGQYVAVPEVLGHGEDVDGSWLHTRGLPGRSAVDPVIAARPEVATRAIGAGLRALHDRLPVSGCPWSWSVGNRLRRAGPRARPADLGRAPVIDRLVVCHGDACVPNTLVDDEGRCVGYVDLGALGVADRWADLAVATYSLAWNFPGQWEETLLEAYGVAPDPLRTAYYRALWDAT